MDKNVKKVYTDEERLQLAEKLDKELDDFINGLEKKQYTEGWPEDRWQEEMEKHPFFMTKTPEPGDEIHPLLEGIQQLKYDPDENTPEELALSYKEDGNFYFKNKNYRMAFYSYTEGIKTKCKDTEILSTLYNNRSAASFFLKNYRTCLNDCKSALKLKPNYEKVIYRATLCTLELGLFEECLQYCEQLLLKKPDDMETLNIKKKCLNRIKEKKRDDRKKELRETKYMKEENKIISAIISRGIKIDNCKGGLSLDNLESHFPQTTNKRVYLDENNKLIWPVIIMYPEYQIMDLIQEFHEDDTFFDQMSEVLKNTPEWDVSKTYNVNNINIYFENGTKNKLFKVDLSSSLGKVIQSEEFLIRGGTPAFICLIKNSPTEKNFLMQY